MIGKFPHRCWRCGPDAKWLHFMRSLDGKRRSAYCARCKQVTPL